MKFAKIGQAWRGSWAWFKKLKWYKWLVVAVLLVVVISLILGQAAGDKGQIVAGVLTEKVQERWVEQVVATSGRLEPANKQEFFAPEDSTLMELGVKVGDPVKAGQVLGRLDTGELARLYESSRARAAELEANLARASTTDDRLTLEAAQARYEQQANRLERLQELAGAGAATPAELEAGQSDYAQAKADYEQAKARSRQQSGSKEVAALQAQLDLARQDVALAQERLAMGTFIAEADGVVLEVGAQEGARVMSGTRIIIVGSRQDLEVTCRVGEVDAGNLQPGQKVKITCTAITGQEFTGQVVRVADVAVVSSSQSGSDVARVPVTVRLDGKQTALKPGYTVDLRIITRSGQDALAIPFDAVVKQENKTVVFVVDPQGQVTERPVTTTEGNEVYEIVVSGLKAGEEIVISPPPELKAGMRIIRGLPQ